MKVKILIIIIVLIALVIGGFFVWKNISAPETEKTEKEKQRKKFIFIRVFGCPV